MEIFGIINCDKCRLAQKALDVSAITDVKRVQIPKDILLKAFSTFGDKLLNRSSTTWRTLDPAEKEKNPLELIKKYPTLMKRPLIKDKNGELFLGWSEDIKTALMGKG